VVKGDVNVTVLFIVHNVRDHRRAVINFVFKKSVAPEHHYTQTVFRPSRARFPIFENRSQCTLIADPNFFDTHIIHYVTYR